MSETILGRPPEVMVGELSGLIKREVIDGELLTRLFKAPLLGGPLSLAGDHTVVGEDPRPSTGRILYLEDELVSKTLDPGNTFYDFSNQNYALACLLGEAGKGLRQAKSDLSKSFYRGVYWQVEETPGKIQLVLPSEVSSDTPGQWALVMDRLKSENTLLELAQSQIPGQGAWRYSDEELVELFKPALDTVLDGEALPGNLEEKFASKESLLTLLVYETPRQVALHTKQGDMRVVAKQVLAFFETFVNKHFDTFLASRGVQDYHGDTKADGIVADQKHGVVIPDAQALIARTGVMRRIEHGVVVENDRPSVAPWSITPDLLQVANFIYQFTLTRGPLADAFLKLFAEKLEEPVDDPRTPAGRTVYIFEAYKCMVDAFIAQQQQQMGVRGSMGLTQPEAREIRAIYTAFMLAGRAVNGDISLSEAARHRFRYPQLMNF